MISPSSLLFTPPHPHPHSPSLSLSHSLCPSHSHSHSLRPSLSQRECHYRVSQFGTQLAMPSSRDNDKLFAVEYVRHRRGLSACRKFVLPEEFASLCIKRPEEIVECCRNKGEPS